MVIVVQKFNYCRTRACKLVGLETSTYFYKSENKRDDKVVCDRMLEVAKQKARYGCPRVYWTLKREGFKDNYKRIERLYQKLGLQLNLRKKSKTNRYVPTVEKIRSTK